MTVQGAGAAHQTLEGVVCDPPPEPPVRNTAALQHARGRRRLAQPGRHAAESSAMRIALSEIIFFPGVKEHDFCALTVDHWSPYRVVDRKCLNSASVR